jgi:hypothetical protein
VFTAQYTQISEPWSFGLERLSARARISSAQGVILVLVRLPLWSVRHGIVPRLEGGISWTSLLDGSEWPASRPGLFTPLPIDTSLVGSQSRSGRCREDKSLSCRKLNPDSLAAQHIGCSLYWPSYLGFSVACGKKINQTNGCKRGDPLR